MLFNGNNSYYHFIISKTLKGFFIFPWISSPHGSLGLAHNRYAYCLWELSDANTQTLSGPLTLIRSLWCLECQMVVVAIHASGLTPLPIAGWLALGYEALMKWWLDTKKTNMMTSSNGNIFHITGPLWEEITSHQWRSLTKASDMDRWCFLWSAPE